MNFNFFGGKWVGYAKSSSRDRELLLGNRYRLFQNNIVEALALNGSASAIFR
jgi:hypothetical protein